MLFFSICVYFDKKGLSKFAKLARSVTRSRSVLVSQFSSHIPAVKETSKQSNLAHVSNSNDTQSNFIYLLLFISLSLFLGLSPDVSNSNFKPEMSTLLDSEGEKERERRKEFAEKTNKQKEKARRDLDVIFNCE